NLFPIHPGMSPDMVARLCDAYPLLVMSYRTYGLPSLVRNHRKDEAPHVMCGASLAETGLRSLLGESRVTEPASNPALAPRWPPASRWEASAGRPPERRWPS